MAEDMCEFFELMRGIRVCTLESSRGNIKTCQGKCNEYKEINLEKEI